MNNFSWGILGLLGLLLCPPAHSCGVWSMKDLTTNQNVSFLAESISIHTPKGYIEKKIRPNGEMAYFSNGDRAYYGQGDIFYWHGEPAKNGKRSWRKEQIGTIDGGSFELRGLGKFKVALDVKDGTRPYAEAAVLNEQNKPVATATITPFCAEARGREAQRKIENEAKRMVAYFVWKKMQPDLGKEAPRWW